jgi:hypothetical protein
MQMTFGARSELVIEYRRQRASVKISTVHYKVPRNQNTTSGVSIDFLVPELHVSA